MIARFPDNKQLELDIEDEMPELPEENKWYDWDPIRREWYEDPPEIYRRESNGMGNSGDSDVANRDSVGAGVLCGSEEAE